MARPVKFHVDSQALLRAIFEQTHGRRAALESERAALPSGADGWHDYQTISREITQCDWAEYPSAIVEPGTSDGERRAVLRAVLALEAAGLVRGSGNRLSAVQLTPEGLVKLQEGGSDASDT
jgi:hypothetical protein